mmetsp:Transcript_14084/g.27693  ORF Transcript_14084/g.27693 Transcript_14084/m.27693 type:complete len:282 (+) Transcript_14084:2-847(+)
MIRGVRTRVQRMAAIKAVLCDLSGTLHVGKQPIPGAPEALERLQGSGVKVIFVTNTTKESSGSLYAKLDAMGFKIKREDIWSSLSAAKNLIQERKLRPMLLLSSSAMEDFGDVDTTKPNAVVVGLAPSLFDYAHLNSAFRLMQEEKAGLYAIHKGRYMKTKDGLSMGPGGFVQALEYATGATAEIIGKPAPSFFHNALKRIDAKPTEAVMIGDDVRDDVGGAQACGIRGMLVQTGKYTKGDETKYNVAPWQVPKDFPSAVEFILKHNQGCDGGKEQTQLSS